MTTPNRYDFAARRMLLGRTGPGKTVPNEILLDECWTVGSASADTLKDLNRITRRERIVRPPAGLLSGEAYRTWLLERVDAVAASDATDEERQETEAWRARIAAATRQELWSEYLDQRPLPLHTFADLDAQGSQAVGS